MDDAAAHERVDPAGPSRLARTVLAPNAGPMTLDGTNSYVLQAPGARSTIVVDPGPADAGHLELLAGVGEVELVLITHHHADHTEAIDAFARLTGAPVRAIDPAFCRGAAPLVDGERIAAAGVELEVIATPGHTADSVCFALLGETGASGGLDGPGDAARTPLAVLTGDTILGRGTTIIADPDGALGPYLDSLERLRALGSGGPVVVLPGHGQALPDLAAICDAYLAHRAERLEQMRAALGRLGADASVDEVTDLVYADTDASVRGAAEASVRAQLRYLRGTA
ncbi:MBL fold metallo-hydrolase [Agromyces lapidis]|uniref:MBL fold metallo-hydrolase n=1 Tax=Agromyces lapidis TaxID=279574 RepID=A0ABV5SRZ7_9MICO|nr:MBL fold metallo-hydrolase [Agromyces lapidis]